MSINIATIGTVSAGKSTFVNALLGDNICPSGKIRTTMRPIHFICDQSKKVDLEAIHKYITSQNKSLQQEQSICKTDLSEIDIHMNRVDNAITGLHNDIIINLYDTPGINDAKLRDHYESYINDNLYKFDLILWVLDLNKGFNETDMIGLLQFLVNVFKQHASHHIKFGKSNKSLVKPIKLMLIVNKCDNLDSNLELMSQEDRELFADIYKNITEALHGLDYVQYQFVKLSAKRMFALLSKDQTTPTDEDVINFLKDEMSGKQVANMSPQQRLEKYYELKSMSKSNDMMSQQDLSYTGKDSLMQAFRAMLCPSNMHAILDYRSSIRYASLSTMSDLFKSTKQSNKITEHMCLSNEIETFRKIYDVSALSFEVDTTLSMRDLITEKYKKVKFNDKQVLLLTLSSLKEKIESFVSQLHPHFHKDILHVHRMKKIEYAMLAVQAIHTMYTKTCPVNLTNAIIDLQVLYELIDQQDTNVLNDAIEVSIKDLALIKMDQLSNGITMASQAQQNKSQIVDIMSQIKGHRYEQVINEQVKLKELEVHKKEQALIIQELLDHEPMLQQSKSELEVEDVSSQIHRLSEIDHRNDQQIKDMVYSMINTYIDAFNAITTKTIMKQDSDCMFFCRIVLSIQWLIESYQDIRNRIVSLLIERLKCPFQDGDQFLQAYYYDQAISLVKTLPLQQVDDIIAHMKSSQLSVYAMRPKKKKDSISINSDAFQSQLTILMSDIILLKELV